MNISLDRYKIFAYAARWGNITVAAEKLFISQPAVSQTIRQLEGSLGCTLFLRTPKGVKLTSEGELLYKYVSEGLEAISEGERRLTAMLRLDAGEIRIGASDMTLEFCLLPCLEAFHKNYPNVKISVTNNPTPQTLELLRQERIDFAAVSEPFDSNGYEVFKIREIHDIFICAREKSLTGGISAEDIKNELILLESNTSTRTFIDNEFHRRGFYAVPKFELATSPQIVGFTARDMGIGCVVSDFAEQALKEGKIREIKLTDPLPNRHICVIRSGSCCSLAAEKLFETVKYHFY